MVEGGSICVKYQHPRDIHGVDLKIWKRSNTHHFTTNLNVTLWKTKSNFVFETPADNNEENGNLESC